MKKIIQNNVRLKGHVASTTRVVRQAGNWEKVVSPLIQKLGERISQTEGTVSARELKQQRACCVAVKQSRAVCPGLVRGSLKPPMHRKAGTDHVWLNRPGCGAWLHCECGRKALEVGGRPRT